MSFHPNQKFQEQYDRIFKKDPMAANLFLLICELADKNGKVKTDERELRRLFKTRFNDPMEYVLGRNGNG